MMEDKSGETQTLTIRLPETVAKRLHLAATRANARQRMWCWRCWTGTCPASMRPPSGRPIPNRRATGVNHDP